MITTLIRQVFKATGRQWKIGGSLTEPTENDMKKVLDSAADALYSKQVGSTFSMGGLHVEKTRDGFDVYVHVGEYS